MGLRRCTGGEGRQGEAAERVAEAARNTQTGPSARSVMWGIHSDRCVDRLGGWGIWNDAILKKVALAARSLGRKKTLRSSSSIFLSPLLFPYLIQVCARIPSGFS